MRVRYDPVTVRWSFSVYVTEVFWEDAGERGSRVRRTVHMETTTGVTVDDVCDLLCLYYRADDHLAIV